MARERAFIRAYGMLHAGLRKGAWRPGTRLGVSDVMTGLSISATPVREALSRLAGQWLLEDRPGEGYFVPALDPVRQAELYAVCRSLLAVALADRPGAALMVAQRQSEAEFETSAMTAGGVIRRLAAFTPNGALVDLAYNLDDRLARTAQAELAVFPENETLNASLNQSFFSGDRRPLRRLADRFFARRQRESVAIVQAALALDAHRRNIERI